MIEFEGGGRMVAEFTDVDETDVEVGATMRMCFESRQLTRCVVSPSIFGRPPPSEANQRSSRAR